MAAPIDATTACALLSNPTRRALIELFHEKPVWSVTELAREVAARDRSTPPEELSPETVDRTQVELVHNHVPRLADHDVLEWDSRSGDVVRRDNFEALSDVRKLTFDDERPTVATVSDGR